MPDDSIEITEDNFHNKLDEVLLKIFSTDDYGQVKTDLDALKKQADELTAKRLPDLIGGESDGKFKSGMKFMASCSLLIGKVLKILKDNNNNFAQLRKLPESKDRTEQIAACLVALSSPAGADRESKKILDNAAKELVDKGLAIIDAGKNEALDARISDFENKLDTALLKIFSIDINSLTPEGIGLKDLQTEATELKAQLNRLWIERLNTGLGHGDKVDKIEKAHRDMSHYVKLIEGVIKDMEGENKLFVQLRESSSDSIFSRTRVQRCKELLVPVSYECETKTKFESKAEKLIQKGMEMIAAQKKEKSPTQISTESLSLKKRNDTPREENPEKLRGSNNPKVSKGKLDPKIDEYTKQLSDLEKKNRLLQTRISNLNWKASLDDSQKKLKNKLIEEREQVFKSIENVKEQQMAHESTLSRETSTHLGDELSTDSSVSGKKENTPKEQKTKSIFSRVFGASGSKKNNDNQSEQPVFDEDRQVIIDNPLSDDATGVEVKQDPDELPFIERVKEAFENIFLTNKNKEHMTTLFALRDEANTPSKNPNMNDDFDQEHMENEYIQDILLKVAESMKETPNLLSELKASTEGKERDALKEKCAQLFIPRGVKKGSDEYKHFLSQGREIVETGLDAIKHGKNNELRFEAGLKAIIADVINNKVDPSYFEEITGFTEEAKKRQYTSSSGELIYPSLARMFTSNNGALDGTNLVIKVNELKSAIASGDEEKVRTAENEMVKLCTPLDVSRATENDVNTWCKDGAKNNPFVKLLRDQIPTQYNEKADKAAISRYIKEITKYSKDIEKYSKDIEKLNNNVTELKNKIKNLNANQSLTSDRKSQLLEQTDMALDSVSKLLQGATEAKVQATEAKVQATAAKDVYDAKMAPLRDGCANRMLDKPESKSFLSGFQNVVNKIRSPKNTVPTSDWSKLPLADDEVVPYNKQSDELIMANFKSDQSKLMSEIEAITKKGGNLETKRALMSRLEKSLEQQLKYESSVQLQRQPIDQLKQEFAKLDEAIKGATTDDQEQVTSEAIVSLVKDLIDANNTSYVPTELNGLLGEEYAYQVNEYLNSLSQSEKTTAEPLIKSLNTVFENENAKLSKRFVKDCQAGIVTLEAEIKNLNVEISKNTSKIKKLNSQARLVPSEGNRTQFFVESNALLVANGAKLGLIQQKSLALDTLKKKINDLKQDVGHENQEAASKSNESSLSPQVNGNSTLDAIIKAQAAGDKHLITKAIKNMRKYESNQTVNNPEQINESLKKLSDDNYNLSVQIERLNEDENSGLPDKLQQIEQLKEKRNSIQMEIAYLDQLLETNTPYQPFEQWKSSVIGETSSIMQRHFEQQLKKPKNIKPLERGFTETPISSQTMKKLLNTNVNSGWIGAFMSAISFIWSKLNAPRLPLITKKYDTVNQSSVVVNLLVDRNKVINLTSRAEYDALKDDDKNEVAMEQAIMFMDKFPGKSAQIGGANTDLSDRIKAAMHYLITQLENNDVSNLPSNNVEPPDDVLRTFKTWADNKDSSYNTVLMSLATKINANSEQNKKATNEFRDRVKAAKTPKTNVYEENTNPMHDASPHPK